MNIGLPIIATHINEDQLLHDDSGITFNNGAFMVYERFDQLSSQKTPLKKTLIRIFSIHHLLA